ncbi:hypothetical protein [Mucilaginibacter terrae]|uniref:GLPGLI family protein n=1 Tax=Mucilaginibacter terrae TaxID=1955052 RepID=A0ABU3H353_9SPHI|nr:hypothetical protein [Mucilaginibacter terrae]MDT3405652.1 hypothetical protein [Mucilaginibacter terrae]
MKFILSAFLFILSITTSFAQQAPPEYFETATIKAKFGVRVVFTSRKHAITLDVASDQVKSTEHPYVILVGKQILQFAFTPVIYDTLARTADQQRELVLGYMKSEIDYAKKILNMAEITSTTEWVNINGKPFLLWSYYLAPGDKSNVVKQSYLCTYAYGRVLSINSPLIKDDNETTAKELMMQIGKTFMQYNNYIDLEKLYKAMQNQ